MIIYLGLAGVGIILWLRRHSSNAKGVSIALITAGIIVGGLAFLTPALAGIAHRFWYYGEVLGGAYLAYLLIGFLRVVHARLVSCSPSCGGPLSILAFSGFILLLSLLMFKASVANDDSPLVPEYTLRTGWYDSEVSAAKFAISTCSENFATDWDFLFGIWCFNYVLTGGKHMLKVSAYASDVPTSFGEVYTYEGVFLARKTILQNRYFELGGRWNEIPYPALGEKASEIFGAIDCCRDVVYDNPTTVGTAYFTVP